MSKTFEAIKSIVEKEFNGCPAHNIDHVMRVYNLCVVLAEGDDVDMEVIELSALLHDIGGPKEMADPTGNTDHALVGSLLAKPILEKFNVPTEKITHIQECILSHRSKTENKPKTKEAMILFDADKLDAIGAIGIARNFVWVGKNNANIYKKVDIDEYIQENMQGKRNGRIQDKTKHSPQIDYETKFKYLEECLFTKKAKEICKERLLFHKSFLDRLEQEIYGKL